MALLMSRSLARAAASRAARPLLFHSKEPLVALTAVNNQSLQRHVFHTSPQVSQTEAIDKSHGSKHWINERYLSVALLGLIPAGMIYPAPPIDWALAFVLPMHNYWGMNQVFTDYVHGETLPGVVKALWAGVSVLTVIGLAYLNYNDVGVCKVIALALRM